MQNDQNLQEKRVPLVHFCANSRSNLMIVSNKNNVRSNLQLIENVQDSTKMDKIRQKCARISKS